MKFKVGDLCVTRGSRAPLLNDGSLVVVVGIDPGVKAFAGSSAPYLIRRVDGQRFGYTSCRSTGKDCFYRGTEVWAPGAKLRRFDEPGPAPAGVAKASRKRARKAVAA